MKKRNRFIIFLLLFLVIGGVVILLVIQQTNAKQQEIELVQSSPDTVSQNHSSKQVTRENTPIPTLAPAFTPVPTDTLTPRPAAFELTSIEIPYSDRFYLADDTLYEYVKEDQSKKLVAYNLMNGETKEFSGFESTFDGFYFYVTKDEKHIVWERGTIDLETNKTSGIPFRLVALSPDEQEAIGLVKEEESWSLDVYDLDTLARIDHLTQFTVTDKLYMYCVPRYSASGELFTLAYYEDDYVEDSFQKDRDDAAQSGFIVWQTDGWSKILDFPRDDHQIVDQILFTQDEQAVVISIRPQQYALLEEPVSRIDTFSVDARTISSTPIFEAEYASDGVSLGIYPDGSIIVQPRVENNDDVYLLDPYTGEELNSFHLDNLVVQAISPTGILLVNNGMDEDPFQVVLPIE